MSLVPTRRGQGLDAFNDQLRLSPAWQTFMRMRGLDPANPRLSDRQRKELQATLQAQGYQFPKGIEIDPAGNVNQNEGFGKQAKKWGPIVGGAAVTAFGIPGLMPGVFSGGAAAGGTAATAGGGLGGAYTAVPHAVRASGTGAGGGMGGFFRTLGKFIGSPGGAQITDLAGGLIGAGMQTRSANRAADLQSQYNQQALDFLKQQDARDFAEYLRERDRGWRYQDEDRGRAEEDRQLRLLREREREGRLTPFRAGAERGYQTLSSLLYNPNLRMVQSPAVGSVQRRSFADLLKG